MLSQWGNSGIWTGQRHEEIETKLLGTHFADGEKLQFK